ncbi:MAG: efflux RND transporter periplasmic adaptor subunit [Sphingobacteriia bacterium]|nr:MAG: efflux RND transporter periplasmic adaptor subunit [Sphingobacteriia bacterium]
MKNLFTYISNIIFITVFIACGSNDTQKVKTVEAAVHHEVEKPDIAELTEAQIKTIGIEMGLIEQKQLTASLKANGVLKIPNQHKASVNSLYSGVIRSILVIPGDFVKKGQTIATVSNPEFIQSQSTYLNISSKIQLAELEVKRQQELNEGNAGALKNLQSAETELRNLKISKSTLAQQIRLMGLNPERLSNEKLVSVLNIKSPISGVVSNVIVKMGAYIDLSTTVVEVVDNSRLHLDLFVFEKDIQKLKNNQTIHFSITNNPGKEYDATIHSWGYAFEDESKAVSVHAEVEGDKTGLIEGMNVTAIISLNKVTSPALPTEAIVTVDGQDYIFVMMNAAQKSDSAAGYIFKRIPIARGYSDIGYTAITLLKETPKDVKVVTKGAFFVSAKMTNQEGHEH